MGTKKLEYWQRDNYLNKKALAKTDIQKSVLRQGIDIGRKQTLKEVLEQYRKVNNTWGFVLDFDRWLEQKIKEPKEASK